jgi:hypothetical protein
MSHLMFFVPETDAVTWGAGLPGSPIMEFKDTADRLTVFLIRVAKWSDGTAAPNRSALTRESQRGAKNKEKTYAKDNSIFVVRRQS